MQVVFGILMIITGAASGLLFQDPVVCRFTESNQCYVALGQQLHLQIPLEDEFNLKITNKTFNTRIILKYRKTQSNPPTPNITGWQFVNDNKTLILTSAKRNDSGTYTLDTHDANGTSKGIYSLQLNIEAQVSSVKVSYSCSSSGVMKMSCSADGDNLRFNWISDFNTLSQPDNKSSTLTLNKDYCKKVTCSVENHVSRDHITSELHTCESAVSGVSELVIRVCASESTTVTSEKWTLSSHGTNDMNSKISYKKTYSHRLTISTFSLNTNSLLQYPLLISLCSVVLLIMISIFAFCMYKKRQGPAHAQDKDVEYAEVVPRATKRKQKKKEDEVQYGELVFNTPARNKHKVAKVQDDCVYSHVQHSQ